MNKIKDVAEYIDSLHLWKAEIKVLHQIIKKTPLQECIKWACPCYTYHGKNVVGLAAFKSYVGLWFYQGALLKDENNYLINAQEGTTKALRQWRFENISAIKEAPILAYINESIQNIEMGKNIKAVSKKEFVIPNELLAALNTNKSLNASWNKLSHSCKREYAEYIGEAKKEETRIRRLEKMIPMIQECQGLNDKYKK